MVGGRGSARLQWRRWFIDRRTCTGTHDATAIAATLDV